MNAISFKILAHCTFLEEEKNVKVEAGHSSGSVSMFEIDSLAILSLKSVD